MPYCKFDCAYRFEILHALPLRAPIPFDFVSMRILRGLVVQLEEHQAPRLLDNLQQRQAQWLPVEAPTAAIRLPTAHALLIAARVWRSLILLHCPVVRGQGSSAIEIAWSSLHIATSQLPVRPPLLVVARVEQPTLDSSVAARCADFLRCFGETLDLSDEFEQATWVSLAHCVAVLQYFSYQGWVFRQLQDCMLIQC